MTKKKKYPKHNNTHYKTTVSIYGESMTLLVEMRRNKLTNLSKNKIISRSPEPNMNEAYELVIVCTFTKKKTHTRNETKM